MNLEIKKKRKGHQEIIFLHGELDVYTASRLKEVLIPLVELENNDVIVDLSGLEYMDSTGLGVFIGAYKQSKAHHGKLQLRNANKRVDRLFTITGLADVIEIKQQREDKLDEAN